MKRYSFSREELMGHLTENDLDVNFSDVTFSDIARFVWLDYDNVVPLKLHRSRVPSALLKAIAKDMHLTLMQYGRTICHPGEASAQFIAPIFNHLIGQFDRAIRNHPQTMLHNNISTRGRIEYQFITLKHPGVILIIAPRPDPCSVAQLLAESYACEWSNSNDGISMPVFGILYCGNSFEFYKFDGSLDAPKLLRGYHGTEYRFQLPDMWYANDPQCCQRFLSSLRIVTEIIFDVLLMAYSSSLKTHDHARYKRWYKGNIQWDKGIERADAAQRMFRDGGINHKVGHIQETDGAVLEAMKQLKLSTGSLGKSDSKKPHCL